MGNGSHAKGKSSIVGQRGGGFRYNRCDMSLNPPAQTVDSQPPMVEADRSPKPLTAKRILIFALIAAGLSWELWNGDTEAEGMACIGAILVIVISAQSLGRFLERRKLAKRNAGDINYRA